MFTGIIEELGIIKSIRKEKNNIHFEISSKISSELKPDQSVAHNGACLTITKKNNKSHFVTAVKETLSKTTLASLKVSDPINLERSLIPGTRLDGHWVQGHIDKTSKVLQIINHKGSIELVVELQKKDECYVVNKGSICLNGISLTISKLTKHSFHVVIIPYTLEHTNLKTIQKGDLLNVEFDILAKYVTKNIKKLKLKG